MNRLTLIVSLSLAILLIPLYVSASQFEEASIIEKMETALRSRHLEHGGIGVVPPSGTDADSVHSWDAIHYHIEMELFPTVQQIDASVTVTGISNDANLDSLPIHFEPGMTIQSILVGWLVAGYTWDNDLLTAELDRVYPVGDTFQVQFNYSGTPSMIYSPNGLGGMGMHWGTTIYTYTDPEAARAWFPCYDKPFDKATYSAAYTVPEGYVMASNGNPDSTVTNPNHTLTTYWTHDYPIETYLISIACSNYSEFSDNYGAIPLDYYVYPYHLNAAQFDFQSLPDMMQSFESSFGLYPFEKYGMAEAPIFGGGGAMEHQTMTTLGQGCITGTGAYEFLYVHELGHMWFGDALSIVDWPHIWLSEGFATYSEAVWAQSEYGWEYFQTYVLNYIQNAYMNWENPSNRHAIYNPPPGYLFSTIEYEKAASVLHMVRYYLGEDDFFTMMQDYVETYKYGIVSTDDFQEKCEEYYGDDLDWFFQQWVYEEGYPIFEYFTGCSNISPGNYRITLGISQIQEAELPTFTTHIDAGMYSGGIMTHTETVYIDERLECIEFDYSGAEPDSIVLDPDSWILGRKYFTGEINSPVINYVTHEWEGDFLSQGGSSDLVITLMNTGLGIDNITGSMTTNDPDVTVSAGEMDFGYAGFMSQFSNFVDPFTVDLSSNAVSHWAEMELHLQWMGGDTTLNLLIPVGNPTILLVDDDGGVATDSLVKAGLDTLEMVYHDWNVSLAGPPSDFDSYEMVIWYSGHADNPLTTEEIQLLAEYLDNNGRLLICGTEIASSIPGDAFLTDYLGLDYAGETNIGMIPGVPGNPIGGELTLFLLTSTPDMDYFSVEGGGVVCFNYAGNLPAAVSIENGYKAVTCGFDIGEVRWDNQNFSHLDELLYNVFHWMDVTVDMENSDNPIPFKFGLNNVYPNPFNPVLNIEFTVGNSADISLRIYNIMGQEIEELFNGYKQAGTFNHRWNASGYTSGVYFIEFKTEDHRSRLKKVILLK